MKMYLAELFGSGSIKEVEVDNVGKTVALGGNRREKVTTEYYAWRATREEAKRWILDQLQRKVELAQTQVAYYSSRLEEAKQL